jgi:hypothetical protein
MTEITTSGRLYDGAFHTFAERMERLLDYANAVAPSVNKNERLISELVDSLVVLAVTRLQAFFTSLVSLGTPRREREIRKHFRKHGHEKALTCDMPTLVKLVRNRVSFEDGGKRLDNVFRLVLECSVWPSDEVRDVVLELALLRNLIIHGGGQDWSQDGVAVAAYASQFKRADVLSVRRYGELATYSIDHRKALLFLRDAIRAVVVEQVKYLEERLTQGRHSP